MVSIDFTGLGIEPLTRLLSDARAGVTAGEKRSPKDLRAELERRVAAEGYEFADVFPELGTASSGPARRKRPPRYRHPQDPDQTWSGIGPTPSWVQAILDEHGIDSAAFKSTPLYPIHS